MKLPTRTAAPHGVTGPEISRLRGAVRHMKQYCSRLSRLWWVTIGKGSSRAIIAKVWKRVTKHQNMHRLRAYSVAVFETRGGLHAHIVYVGNDPIADHLKSSAAFSGLIEVAPVIDPDRLVSEYLAKERTPQAGFRRSDLGGRIKGTHALAGGGDRVRPSRELERDAIEAGYIAPWQHTNARRAKTRKLYRPRQLKRRALRPAGQLPLLPEIERPVTRLRQFGGHYLPKVVAIEAEFKRRRIGLSQHELAARIGCSQGQYANAIRGHDPLSPFVTNRLRDVLGI
jgi:hypothetical protein